MLGIHWALAEKHLLGGHSGLSWSLESGRMFQNYTGTNDQLRMNMQIHMAMEMAWQCVLTVIYCCKLTVSIIKKYKKWLKGCLNKMLKNEIPIINV